MQVPLAFAVMASQRNPTRQRLIKQHQLFAAQGMTETTTREIAEL